MIARLLGVSTDSVRAVLLTLAVTCLTLTGTAMAQDGGDSSGGTIRIAVNREAATLDPHLAADNPTYQVLPLLHAGLVTVDVDGLIKPMLASSWEVSDDATSWRFHIREGALFHDGTAVTADDVKFSLERDQDESLQISRRLLGAIESINVIDDYTVDVKLTEPYQPFISALATKAGYIIPREYTTRVGAAAFAQEPVGAGPMRLERIIPGVGFDFVRFDDFFLGRPNAARVEVRVVPEASTQVSQLLAGAVDVITAVNSDNLTRLQESGMTVLGAAASGSLLEVQINATPDASLLGPTGRLSPLRDMRLREAIAIGVDWDLIVETFMPEPLGFRASGFMPPSFEGPAKPAFDPQRARELIAEAGYADGLELEIITLSDRNVAIELQSQLQSLGINAYITIIAGSSMYPKIFDSDFDLFVSSWSGGGAYTGWGFMNQFFSSTMFGSPGNRSRLADPEIDRMLDLAVGMGNSQQQEAQLQEAEALAWERLLTIIPLAGNAWPIAYHPDRVEGYLPHPQGLVTVVGPTHNAAAK